MSKIQLQNITDDKLWSLIKEDNQLAFNEVYNRYWKILYSYIHNILNDRGVTEDTLQDIFFNIWHKRKAIEIKSLKNYLFNAARNRAISKIRKDRFSILQEGVIENLYLPTQSDIEETLNLNDLKATIEEKTKSLPKRCRDIFYLSRYHDFSIAEIANHFNISHRTVENQIYLALKHLRTKLGDTAISIMLFWLCT
ncbi:RNA polymerase sigma-70 factor [Muricauda ruestringensis]|uniref:RNA polymerase sigma factor n=1 Tax=Flagellimonas ruestringensis TaxID=111501 RepID=UPI001CD651D5|nr:RNA polymerase sigma-70 factor [Allomuricauda ruestringensis]MCA0957465.1 RNA polymerase sigma-70 factor [Allomuricauda ruestringensis]